VTRPRWHDVAITAAIVAVIGYGVWALWWGDVRGKTDAASPSPQGSGAPTAMTSDPQT
jgi:hypothetical protein